MDTEKTTDIDDLFAGDADTDTDTDTDTAPDLDYDGSVSDFKAVAADINDEALAVLAEYDSRKGVRDAAAAEIARRATADTTPSPPEADTTDAIDTAVRIRRLDWECECGNTNTLDLRRCGKCHQHRYR